MPLLENLVCEFFLEWFGGAKIIVAGLNLMRLMHCCNHLFIHQTQSQVKQLLWFIMIGAYFNRFFKIGLCILKVAHF